MMRGGGGGISGGKTLSTKLAVAAAGVLKTVGARVGGRSATCDAVRLDPTVWKQLRILNVRPRSQGGGPR